MGRAVFKVLSAENFEINTNLYFGSCISFEGKPVTRKIARNLARFGECQVAGTYLSLPDKDTQ